MLPQKSRTLAGKLPFEEAPPDDTQDFKSALTQVLLSRLHKLPQKGLALLQAGRGKVSARRIQIFRVATQNRITGSQ